MNDFIIENGILIKYTGNARNIVIPEEVTEIGESAFYSCLTVTSIKLHNRIIKIGDSAFSDCAALEKINIPESVQYLGSYAFYDCTRLSSVAIPASIVRIGMETFSGCTRLTDVILSKSITVIEQMAFAFCPLIEKVYYLGSESDWKNLRVDLYNEPFILASRHYYSESAPNGEGAYWHYQNNNPVIWATSNPKINSNL